MTRPATLSSAAERIAQGVAREVALSEFLDNFYGASDESRLAMLDDEPPFVGDARTDALMGAICEYLAKQFCLPRIPRWAGDKRRVLAEPWFTISDGNENDAMCEYLAVVSPGEFRNHNIFTEAMPLRRARDPRGRSTADAG